MRQLAILTAILALLALLTSCGDNGTDVLEQCAQPEFSLPGGPYTQGAKFSITCPTPGARIYYTTNGRDPVEGTTDAIEYTDSLAFSRTMIFRARAYRLGMAPSEVAYARYRVGPIPDVNLADIAAGTFTMGRGDGTGDNDELPAHSVTLPAFKMSKTEVTQGDLYNVLGYYTITMNSNVNYWQQLPGYGMNWYASLAYCNLLSLATGLAPVYTIKGTTDPDVWGAIPSYFNPDWDAVTCNWEATGYRLPTEAEWEYAAGLNMYAGSDSLEEVGWFFDNCDSPEIVASRLSNLNGLFDMSGNVWEWCWDRMDSLYYAASPSNHPKGPDAGSHRILRGGGWNAQKIACRVKNRNSNVPYYKNSAETNIGFRVVRKP